MVLSNFSVKRPIAMVVIIIGLMGLGLLALSKLRVNQFPDIEPPLLVVTITYPGASPDSVEREIVTRLDKTLLSISGVDRMAATAKEGSAQFLVFFSFSKNLIEAADEVRNAIGSVRHKLPTEIREPVITRADPSAQPVMQLALSSTAQSHADLSRLAEDDLADRLRGAARRGHGQRQRRAAARTLGAAACREAARVFDLGGRGRGRAARAEHHRAGGQGARCARRPEHPPGRPYRDAGRVRADRRPPPRQ